MAGPSRLRRVQAATGAAALGLLANPIDIAVLDVNLPDMSGFEICEAIRANPACEWIPIVHVSATAIGAQDDPRACCAAPMPT